MGAMLNLLPMKAQLGIRLAALLVAVAVVAAAAFVLGFDRTEVAALWLRFRQGLATALHGTVLAGSAAAGAAQRLRQPRAEGAAPARPHPPPAAVPPRRHSSWNPRCPSQS